MSLRSPYKGPDFFTTQDEAIFFGREQETRDLVSMVSTERVVLFYAPSGAGKSSLLHAGLIPRLRSKRYEVLPPVQVSSGSDIPENVRNIYAFNVMSHLATAQEDSARFDNLALSEFLWRLSIDDNRRYFYDASDAAMRPATPTKQLWPRILILDQFEELLTHHPTHWPHRAEFISELNEALQIDPMLRVVLTLRSDYVTALDRWNGLLQEGMRARYHMLLLDKASALEAVVRPVEEHTYRKYEPVVAEALVDNLSLLTEENEAGDLQVQPGEWVEPIQLQVVCQELWNSLPSGTLITMDDLRAVMIEQASEVEPASVNGEDTDANMLASFVHAALSRYYERRLSAALATVSDSEHSELEAEARHWISDHLITPQGTRDLVQRNSVASSHIPESVIDSLIDSHLLRSDRRGNAELLEIIHDRFVEPIRQSNQAYDLRLLTDFPWIADARKWYQSGNTPDTRDKRLLPRGEALDRIQTQVESRSFHENAVLEYLSAAKIARQGRSSKRRRRRLIATLVLLVILVGIGAFFLARGNIENSRANTADQAINSLKDNDLHSAMNAAIRSHHLVPGPLLNDSPHFERLSPHFERLMRGLPQSPSDKSHFALNMVVYALQISHRFPHLDGRALYSVAYAPRQQMLAAGADDGSIMLRHLESGAVGEIGPKREDTAGHAALVWSVALSHDGRHLLSGGDDGQVIHWQIDLPLQNKTEAAISAQDLCIIEDEDGEKFERVFSVAFHPKNDGIALIGTANTNVYLVDLNACKVIHTLSGHDDYVYDVSFGPDGTQAVSGSEDGTMILWDLKQQEGKRFGGDDYGHKDWVRAVALSPDGKQALSASNDLRLWDLESGELQRVFDLTPDSVVYDLAYTHDGESFLVASDGLTLWDINSGRNLRQLQGHEDNVRAVAFGEDRRAATASLDGTANIWDLETGNFVESFGDGQTDLANFLPVPNQECGDSKKDPHDPITQGSTVILGRHRTLTGLDQSDNWSPEMNDYVGEVTTVTLLDGLDPWACPVAFVEIDGGQHYWRTRDMDYFHAPVIQALDVSPDGHLALTADDKGSITLLDIPTGRTLHEVKAHNEPIVSVAFLNNELFVSASEDNRFLLWSIYSSEQIHILHSEPDSEADLNGSVLSLAVHPHDTGVTVSAGLDNGDVIKWVMPHTMLKSIFDDTPERDEMPPAFELVEPPDQPAALDTGVIAISISDGPYVAYSTGEEFLVWDTERSVEISLPKALTDDESQVIMSVWGRKPGAEDPYLLVATMDNVIFLTFESADSLREERKFSQPSQPNAGVRNIRTLALAPDATWALVATRENGEFRLTRWDLVNNVKSPLTDRYGSVPFVGSSIAIDPVDGQWAVSDSPYGDLNFFGIAGQSQSHRLNAGPPAIFTPDGLNIITADQMDGLVRWDVAADQPTPVRFTADDEAERQRISALALHPTDENTILAGSFDGDISLFNLDDGSQVELYDGDQSIYSLAARNDDEQGVAVVAGMADGNIILFDSKNQQIEDRWTLPDGPVHAAPVTAVAISRDGKTVLSGDLLGRVMLWTDGNPTPALLSKDIGAKDIGAAVRDAAIVGQAGSTQTLVIGLDTGEIVLWKQNGNDDDWEPKHYPLHKGPIHSIAISPDDEHLVSGAEDKTLVLFDLDEQQDISDSNEQPVIASFPVPSAVWHVSYATDGSNRILTSSADNLVRIWHLAPPEHKLYEWTMDQTRRHVGANKESDDSPDRQQEVPCYDSDKNRLEQEAVSISSGDIRRGTLLCGGKETWRYQASGAEYILVSAMADRPVSAPSANHVERGQLDLEVDIVDSENHKYNRDASKIQGLRDSVVQLIHLPAAGEYRINVRNQISTTGSYTLVVDSPETMLLGEVVASTTAEHSIWSFEANAGQGVTISLKDANAGSYDPYLTLFGPGGTVLEENDNSGGHDGLDASIAAVLKDEGKYFIYAGPTANDARYEVTWTAPERIDAGTPQRSELSQQAIWKFDGKEGQLFSVALKNVEPGILTSFDPFLAIYQPDGTELFHVVSDDQFTDEVDFLTAFLPVDGTYFIKASNNSFGTAPILPYSRHPYELELTEILPEQAEPGKSQQLNAVEQPWWRFYSEKGKITEIRLESANKAFTDPKLELWGVDSILLGDDDDGGGGRDSVDARIVFLAPDDDTYYLRAIDLGTRVRMLGHATSTAALQLKLTEVVPGQINPGMNVQSTTNKTTWWKFKGEEGQKIQIALKDTGNSPFDPELTVYDPDGIDLRADNSADGLSDQDALLELRLLKDGDYYIHVGRAGSDATYQLELSVPQ